MNVLTQPNRFRALLRLWRRDPANPVAQKFFREFTAFWQPLAIRVLTGFSQCLTEPIPPLKQPLVSNGAMHWLIGCVLRELANRTILNSAFDPASEMIRVQSKIVEELIAKLHDDNVSNVKIKLRNECLKHYLREIVKYSAGQGIPVFNWILRDPKFLNEKCPWGDCQRQKDLPGDHLRLGLDDLATHFRQGWRWAKEIPYDPIAEVYLPKRPSLTIATIPMLTNLPASSGAVAMIVVVAANLMIPSIQEEMYSGGQSGANYFDAERHEQVIPLPIDPDGLTMAIPKESENEDVFIMKENAAEKVEQAAKRWSAENASGSHPDSLLTQGPKDNMSNSSGGMHMDSQRPSFGNPTTVGAGSGGGGLDGSPNGAAHAVSTIGVGGGGGGSLKTGGGGSGKTTTTIGAMGGTGGGMGGSISSGAGGNGGGKKPTTTVGAAGTGTGTGQAGYYTPVTTNRREIEAIPGVARLARTIAHYRNQILARSSEVPDKCQGLGVKIENGVLIAKGYTVNAGGDHATLSFGMRAGQDRSAVVRQAYNNVSAVLEDCLSKLK